MKKIFQKLFMTVPEMRRYIRIQMGRVLLHIVVGGQPKG